MSDIVYCRVTFDDASYQDMLPEEYEKIKDACKDFLMTGHDEIYEGLTLDGHCMTFFYISKVQDVFMSSPASREMTAKLNKELKEERIEHMGYDDDA